MIFSREIENLHTSKKRGFYASFFIISAKDHFLVNELFKEISNEKRAIEKIITGMRTMRGVKLTTDIKKQVDMNWIKNHKDLVEINSEYLHTTEHGLLILDDLIVDLIK